MSLAWRSFAIIPAAGKSTRMGQPKLLLPWNGSTVLEQTIAAWRTGGVHSTVVVVRPGDLELAARAEATGAQVVRPQCDPPQMKDSILIGLDHVERIAAPGEQDVWLLAPADMPWLSPSAIRTLLSQHQPKRPQILVPMYGGERGHPVLFPWSTVHLVRTLSETEGVNALLERSGWTAVQVDSPTIHGDLDTPDDYRSRQPPS